MRVNYGQSVHGEEEIDAVVSVLRAAYALLARLVAPYPRLRAAVEAVAAIGPDPIRAILQALRAVTGRALPWTVADARDAEIAALRAEVARLQGPSTRAAERGSARVGVLAMVLVPGLLMVSTIRFRSFKSFDLGARRTYPVLIVVAGAIALLVAHPEIVLMVLAYGYLISPIIGLIVQRLRRGKGPDAPAATPVS